MDVALYDPLPMRNDYFTKMFAAPMREYAAANSIKFRQLSKLIEAERGETVVVLTDHLSDALILFLKNNGNRIVGFNVTDSSYFSESIRHAPSIQLIDLIFMVSGVPTTNKSQDFGVDQDFNVSVFDKPFLPEEEWAVFDYMRRAGKLQSLPYVPWSPIPDVPWVPYAQRSQKALLRGGGHSRRFILALFLMLQDLMDVNSGFQLGAYFADDMNPAFRYCDECRATYKRERMFPYATVIPHEKCISPAARPLDGGPWYDLSNLGHWNNRCPRSFCWMAAQFAKRYGAVDLGIVEKMLNVGWLHDKDHQRMLARIVFTSDLKWIHSIYEPQRFWQGAAAGSINVLPSRTMDQEYFPKTLPGQHYLIFEESFKNLNLAFSIDEATYNQMAGDTRRMYDTWIAPTVYAINTNLLSHIFDEMRNV